MCGILGIGGARGPELVRQLVGDLVHRGPDDEGSWSSPEVALGHRRLSIIGLDEGGRQPMVSRSGGSVIVFNGEIYNYLEIADRLEAAGRPADRRYDTAILLEALETWGLDALPELNGMFAFAWYRPAERRLLLVRDRWGKKPLFWGSLPVDEGRPGLVFSSELRTFTRLAAGAPAPDPLGVVRYLVYDGMPDARTVYQGVFKVPAASWVEVDRRGNPIRRGSYYRFDPDPRPVDPQLASEGLREELSRALQLRLRSDVPVGLFLSGGLDSATLALLWRRLRPGDRIRTFCVGFEEPSYDERASARVIGDAIDAEHHEIVATGRELEQELDFVWDHLSEPFADPSIVPVSLLCRFARSEVKVVLGGDGGDEIFAGYDPFRAWRTARLMEHVLPRRAWYLALKLLERALPPDPANMSLRFKVRHFAQGFDHPCEERVQGWMASFLPALALKVLKPELAREVDPEQILEPSRRAFRAARGRGELYAQIHTWLRTYLECSILAKVDRASMMHSLEVRSPFLDPQLVTAVSRLPADLLFRSGKGKYLLRQAGLRILPPAALKKPKKGLGVPQADWLRSVLRERMEDSLRKARSGGWFDHRRIGEMWRAHLEGRADYRKSLWNFLFSFPFQSA